MSKSVLVAILFFLLVIGALVYSTLELSQHSCEVCITYKGQTNCSTASAPSREEATRTATDVACSPISGGMTESIQCTNTKPDSVSCSQN